jgi:hypothetical protein
MLKTKIQYTTGFITMIMLTTLALPAPSLAQNVQSGIVITRTPYLSISTLPASFTFGSATTAGSAQNVFSNGDDNLPGTTNLISVRDTRDSGGFILQAQASDFTSGTNAFSASNLRIATSGTLASGTEPENELLKNNIFYLYGYAGKPDDADTENATTPIFAASSKFGQISTFNAIESRPAQNRLNAPVDVISACLPATSGRVGTMATGVAFNLNVPAYTQAGDYHSTITYTVMDFTQDQCP